MKNKFFYYLNLLKTIILRFFFNLKNFGIKVAFFNFFGEISEFNLWSNKEFFRNVRINQRAIVYNKLTEKYSSFIEEYAHKNVPIGVNNKKIWCMWWQGIENAPDLIKVCINSIEKYSEDYELVIITKDNFENYAEFPPEIIKKLEVGEITVTHFSDIMRARLLSLYGGIWVDATMFICDHIFKEFDDIAFNTSSSNGSWLGFFMGGKPNKLFSFLYDFLILYNLEYDVLINYYLIDLVIEIAYNSFDECREFIDNSTIFNPQIFYFLRNISKKYDENEFKSLCKNYKFFKLSYKNSMNLNCYDNNGNLTYYGYLLKCGIDLR